MTASTIPAVTTNARLAQFFERINPARGRIILAIDATASRQPAWDITAKLQNEMFKSASGLDVQLVFYRGLDQCSASRWMSDPGSLGSFMSGVMCQAGPTQIGKVLAHAAKEHRTRRVDALVVVSDACEESPEFLYARAQELGVPIFLFQEGDDPTVAEVYGKIARLTRGAVARFDATATQRLAGLLRAVAVFATGGVKALTAAKTEAAALLLAQMKR